MQNESWSMTHRNDPYERKIREKIDGIKTKSKLSDKPSRSNSTSVNERPIWIRQVSFKKVDFNAFKIGISSFVTIELLKPSKMKLVLESLINFEQHAFQMATNWAYGH